MAATRRTFLKAVGAGLVAATAGPPRIAAAQQLVPFKIGPVVLGDFSINAPLFVATEKGNVLKLDPASGAVLASADLKAGIRCPLTLTDRGLLVACEDGALHFLSPDLGSSQWKRHLPGVARSLKQVGGQIILGAEDRALHVLRLADGIEQWSVNLEEIVHLTPVVEGSNVWAATERRTLFVLDLTSGQERRRIPLHGLPASDPSLDGDRILLGMRSGEVVALSKVTGEACFRLSATRPVSARPAVLPTGILVIASQDRLVRGYLPPLLPPDPGTGDQDRK